MSEQIGVVIFVVVIYSIFFYMAHKADKIVREKAKERQEQTKTQNPLDNKKNGKRSI